MVVLFDYDSLIYKASYRIVDIPKIRQWIEAEKSREWMENEIIDLSINRLCNMGDDLFVDLEDVGINITEVEYYITACRDSVRNRIDPKYKSNRHRNKWVNKVRSYLLDHNFAVTSNEYEADDLIHDRAEELGEGNFVILTMDKDLKQIPGIHFDYYRPIEYVEGEKRKMPCRGLDIVSEERATRFFWYQMLTGDHGDFIKGLPGIGPKRATKRLIDVPTSDLEIVVRSEYMKKFPETGELEFNKNYFLLKLGCKNRDMSFMEEPATA